jgi:membrane protein involved in colicin uptake
MSTSARKVTLEDLFGDLDISSSTNTKGDNQATQIKVSGFRKQKEFGARKRIKP